MAADSPAGRPAACSSRPARVGRSEAGSSSAAAARPLPGPYAVRIQVPTLIGELGLATRSMWWKRSGRPRSAISRYMLTSRPPNPPRRPARRSAGRPVRSAPAASRAEPADRPPVNRYAGIFHPPHRRFQHRPPVVGPEARTRYGELLTAPVVPHRPRLPTNADTAAASSAAAAARCAYDQVAGSYEAVYGSYPLNSPSRSSVSRNRSFSRNDALV